MFFGLLPALSTRYIFHVKINFFYLNLNRIRIQIRIEIKSWIRIRVETNADPQHWFLSVAILLALSFIC
jgi:hypothetical protein